MLEQKKEKKGATMFPKNKSKIPLIVVLVLMYIMFIVAALQTGVVLNEDVNHTFITAFMQAMNELSSGTIRLTPITTQSINQVFVATAMFAVMVLLMVFDEQRNKRDAPGIESGSAAWNTDLNAYNKEYSDPPGSTSNKGDKNMILTQDVHLNMDTRATMRNNNVLVVGGSGSGKTRFMVKPNLLQANSSFVITDPNGALLESTGSFLKSQGYKIKLFNLVDMKHSNCYNPFNYIRDDLGVLTLINCLIKNTTPPDAKASDPFWEKTETALLQALMFYLIKYRPKEEQNFTSVMRLLRAADVDENNPNAESLLDKIFKEVAKRNPQCISLKQYMVFKQGAGKTLKSILISCSVRLTVFNMKEIENLTGSDNIDLGSLGDEKQALFVIIPTADDTYNFLASMMYSQLFETLYYHAENECEGKRLPYHVRFMLDEFANIGQIPNFTQRLATMRQYEISCTIILQNLAQIKALYKDDWEGMIGNCDSFLFLGGKEFSTLEYISNQLGEATIVVRNTGMSMGKSGSSSKNFNRSARKLMTPDELLVMENEDCILMIRGLRPFYGKKYDYPKHKNYKYTGDADTKNNFPYREVFNNSKASSPLELSIRQQQERAERIRSAQGIDITNKDIQGGPTDQRFTKDIGAETPDDIKDKFQKKIPSKAAQKKKQDKQIEEVEYPVHQ